MEKIDRPPQALVSISVVSHRQMALICGLMQDIQENCANLNLELILTLNLDEALTFFDADYSYPVKVIRNLTPRGFGANHNQAFKQASGQFFCVINPDIRFDSDPFPMLVSRLRDPAVGVVAPLVVGTSGELEDSVRCFPTPRIILAKVFGHQEKAVDSLTTQNAEPDWVGGMFMLFSSQVFERLHGFDERYFLYYEDVDLCARLRLEGYRVVVCPQTRVIHHAQRSSHRSLKFLRWHIASMLRFFLSPVYRQLNQRRRP
ncbi:glycosyltransferase [Rhodoferax sp.]|uniref:glycosyltransferase n=1 Tax=Rhodoferax sp. TaxID=50421 RepID=UPI002629B2A7|nr:glycosyltransferase [Rhodoferax sp.]MDD2918626.1 glycosyltransferase [Rhodoferax sp.]